MSELYQEFLRCMHQFGKIKVRDLFPEVSQGEFMTLVTIKCGNEEKEGITISELADKTHVLPPAVSRSLKGLEDRGYVERIIKKQDRRNTYVVLTESGKQVLAEAEETMKEFSNAVVSKLKEEDMKRLIAYMDELYAISVKEIEARKKKIEGKDKNE